MNDNALETVNEAADLDIKKMLLAIAQLKQRCATAGIAFEDVEDDDSGVGLQVMMKNGRNVRPMTFWSPQSIQKILDLNFEKFVFLGEFDAICCYENGTIEAGIRMLGTSFVPMANVLAKIINSETNSPSAPKAIKIEVPSTQAGLPNIEISPATDEYVTLTSSIARRFTIKLNKCHVSNHDLALELLQKLSGSLFLQIDLLKGIGITLERRRKFIRKKKSSTAELGLAYPQTQYEKAPLALYNYGRSAAGMPLLQFLAFYQTIEFYFPIYSQSEAHRKIKNLLKDPLFRINQDADISRLLATVQSNKAGGFGDERAQLKATLMECTDAESIRKFLADDVDRKDFLSGKSKYHKLPIANSSLDLRADVAERIYDIRCKIVHTKSDSRDSSVELLLPFTKESDQLVHDIDLVQFVAQRVLIAGSSPLNIHG